MAIYFRLFLLCKLKIFNARRPFGARNFRFFFSRATIFAFCCGILRFFARGGLGVI